MQRFLLAAVFVSVGAIVPTRAAAQASSPLPPAAVTPPASKPPSAATPAKPTSGPKKGDDRLSDEAELARVVGLYEAGKYRECDTELQRLLDPTSKSPLRLPATVENARVYWAACLMGAGDTDAADAPLRAAIHENPQMKAPDGLVFPQPVVDHFLKVRDSLVNEIRAAEQARIQQAQAEARTRQQNLARERDYMRQLEQLAREETLVVRNRRGFALVPFGVGQFQNREPVLGYTLLVSEALLGGLSLTAQVVQSRLYTQAYELSRSGKQVDATSSNRNNQTWGTVKTLSFWGFAALMVGGIVQAQVDYVPEFRETRTRPLPAPKAQPLTKPVSVSALPYFDGAKAGVEVLGRF